MAMPEENIALKHNNRNVKKIPCLSSFLGLRNTVSNTLSQFNSLPADELAKKKTILQLCTTRD
jgi:hypothetical protein